MKEKIVQIHIAKDKQHYGPYSEADVAVYLKDGQFSGSDLAWIEGFQDWVPLSQLNLDLPPETSSLSPISAANPPTSSVGFSDMEILEIAKRQKASIWLVPGLVVALFYPYAHILTSIWSMVVVYKLARSVGSPDVWFYAVVGLIPMVGVIALIFANFNATKALTTRGVRVGLMGANQNDLRRLAV